MEEEVCLLAYHRIFMTSKHNMKQSEETLVEVQESPEPHGDDRTLVEQERDLGLSTEQHPAAERQSQDDTSKESSERDARVQELAEKNELLEDRLQSVTNERDTIAAARNADLEHFAQERETHKTQRADLQGSLDFANTEHRIHMDHCAQERTAAAERSAEQTQELERVRQVHAAELAAVQQANEQHVSTLQARNEALEDRVVEANAARDAIAASYEAHIARTNEEAAVQETQHAALQGSLEFATTEHRIHVEHCAPARTADQTTIEELTAQLAAERAARAQDQAERDELKKQNALVNDENAALKAKLAAMEHAMQKDDDTPTRTHVDVGQPSTVTSSEATTYVQSESPSPDPFALALPPSPSLLFTPTKHRVLVEEFVEGSSRDGLLTPFSAGMIDGATSTPWHPPPREEHVPLPASSSTLSDIDFEHLDYDPELMKLLRSESMESVHLSPSALGSALGSTSTRSDMSLSSTAESSQSPHFEICLSLPSSDSLHSAGYPTPSPSGSSSFWDFDSFLPSPSEFVEGSSRDGLLTPFSDGIIGATSTPWHPPREEHVPLPTSSSTLSDTDIDRVMDKLQRSDYDHDLVKLLRSESMESESFHPSLSASALGSTSTCSDMSLASTAEPSQSPHIEIRLSLPSSDSLRSMSYPTPPPSGSTSLLDLVPSSPSPREFVEGSSRDGLLTPFSAGIIGATSTPWHPHRDHLPPSFDSRSMLSDMDLTSTTDDLQQPEDDHELSQLLETESLESFYPLLDACTSGSTSTGSNMSIASMAERPQSPHIEIRVSLPSSNSLHSEAYPTPPPSGSTSFLNLEPEPSLPPLPSIIINDGDDISNDDGPIPPGLLAFINAPRVLPPPPSPEPSISFLMPDLEPSLPLPSILINDGDDSSIYDGPTPPRLRAIIDAPRLLPPPPSPEPSFLMPDVELSLPPPPSIIINDGDDSSIYDGPLPPNFGARILPPPPPPEPSFLMPDSDSEPSLPTAPDQSGSFILEDDSSDMLSATGIQLSPSFLRPTAPRLQNESSAFSARTVPAFLRPSAPRRRPRAV